MLNRNRIQRLIYILRRCSLCRAQSGEGTALDALALETYEALPHDTMRRLMVLLFFENAPLYDILFDLCIERSTLYVWRRDILYTFYVHGLKKGFFADL